MDHAAWNPMVTVDGRTGVADAHGHAPGGARTAQAWADLVKINAAGAHSPGRTLAPGDDLRRNGGCHRRSARSWERVAAHAHGGPGITDALRAGLDSVEHGVWLTQEQLRAHGRPKLFLRATLCTHSRGLIWKAGHRLVGWRLGLAAKSRP